MLSRIMFLWVDTCFRSFNMILCSDNILLVLFISKDKRWWRLLENTNNACGIPFVVGSHFGRFYWPKE